MTDPYGMTALSSDAELISAARSGDGTSYGILYERHERAARRLAGQIVRAPADADDLVAEAFTKVLGAIRHGSGPTEAFRPYLLATVRRAAYDQIRKQHGHLLTDGSAIPDVGEARTDPAIASFERSLVARAFRSLPERWSAVLWHTEVEQARPAEVALLLGVTANSVAALSYRAREGLRQAYLQMHLSARARRDCDPIVGKLGAHVRGGLSSRDALRVDDHLRACGDCTAAFAELKVINSSLRGILGPAVLGGEAAAYLAHASHAAAQAGSATVAATTAARSAGKLILHWPTLPVVASLTIALVLAPTAALVYPHIAGPRPGEPAAGARAAVTSPAAKYGGAAQPLPVPGNSRGSGGTSSPPPVSPTPEPSPSGSAPGSPSPSPSLSPSPSPSGSSSQSSLLSAALTVTVNVSGVLNLGVVAVVTVSVANPGTAATAGLTATVTAPSGTALLGLSGQPKGWTCSAVQSGSASCSHDPIAAGATAAVAYRLLVVNLAGCGEAVQASATSGSLSATGTSQAQVGCTSLLTSLPQTISLLAGELQRT